MEYRERNKFEDLQRDLIRLLDACHETLSEKVGAVGIQTPEFGCRIDYAALDFIAEATYVHELRKLLGEFDSGKAGCPGRVEVVETTWDDYDFAECLPKGEGTYAMRFVPFLSRNHRELLQFTIEIIQAAIPVLKKTGITERARDYVKRIRELHDNFHSDP